MGGREQQRQHARHGLFHGKAQLTEQPECDERGENAHPNVGDVADHDAAHGRVVAVTREDRPVRNPRPQQIGGQHEQRLTDAIPAIETSATTVQAKLGILVGENLRLRGPEPMRGLKPMHRVGRPQLARLHDESEQPRGQTQKKKWIAQPSSEARSHRLDGNPEMAVRGSW